MNNNKQVINSEDLDKGLVVDKDSLGLKDFTNSFDKDKVVHKEDNNHLETYLMNLRSSLVELSKVVVEVNVEVKLDRGGKIL